VNFHQLMTEAFVAGETAAKAHTPKPMTVVQVDPITRAVIKTYAPVADGVCGFAYIKIRPANGPLARWLKAQNIGHKAYEGGWEFSIHEYGQSYERKLAHAQAAADVLKAAGINAYAYGRID
jgi:hypothetical protein